MTSQGVDLLLHHKINKIKKQLKVCPRWQVHAILILLLTEQLLQLFRQWCTIYLIFGWLINQKFAEKKKSIENYENNKHRFTYLQFTLISAKIKTLKIARKGGERYRETLIEDNISIIKERGFVYIGYATPVQHTCYKTINEFIWLS